MKTKNNSTKPNQTNFPEVLGQTVEDQIIPSAESGIKGIVKEVWNNSKDNVSEKVDSAKNEVMQSVQKEITNLTQSQIEALKLQICQDLGVVPKPSATPKPQ